MPRRRWARGLALTVLMPALTVAPAAPSNADPADDLGARFQQYGNTSSAWSGGDGTQSLRLTDGRVLWFFADTFYGDVVDGTRRPFGASMIRNSMVIQNGTSMSTVMGGSDASPGALVSPARSGEWLWPADQMSSGGAVYKFYQRFSGTGGGAFGFLARGVELVRMPIATISDPSTYAKVVLPASADCGNSTSAPRCLLWGTDLLTVGSWTYVYGTEVTGDGNKHLHVARVPAGNFAASGWRYWNGTSWGTNAGASKRLMNGVQEGFSVSLIDGRYVLLTQALEGALAGDLVVYYASSPRGFNGSNRSRLWSTPETTTDWGRWTYEYRIVEHMSSGNQITVSYNLNSQYKDGACAEETYWNASVYRPRFKTLTLPASPTGGSDVLPTTPPVGAPWTMNPPAYCQDNTVAAPVARNVSLQATPGAQMSLTWSQPVNAGQWNYDLQYRDVSAGQGWETWGAPGNTRSGFFFAPSPNRWDLWGFHPGHTYEARVRATSWSGAASPWVTSAAVAYLAVPTSVRATRTNSYTCSVTWEDGQPGVMWEIRERNTRTGDTRVLGPFSTRSASIGFFTSPSDLYEFNVRAVNSLGSGGWSSGAVC